nr:proline dehydrogenase family protein [Flexivirga oryzae]
MRQGLLGLGRSDSVRRAVERTPVSRSALLRLVAGEDVVAGVGAATGLLATGRLATLSHLGEETVDVAQASRNRDAHLAMLTALREAGATDGGAAELSIKLSALGRGLPEDGEKIALDNARQICEAAAAAGTTVTVDMEHRTVVDATLEVVRDLRADFPWVGAVLLADLRRTEADCRDLATPGSRVRLCKGSAVSQPGSVAYQGKQEVRLSYVRCAKILLEGEGHPMLATHDADLVDIARSIADKELRSPESFEVQMFFGIRPEEQLRLARAGVTVRVYVPYGDRSRWYRYAMHRIAERPADTRFLFRSGTTKG